MSGVNVEMSTLVLLLAALICLGMAEWSHKHESATTAATTLPWALCGLLFLGWAATEAVLGPSPERTVGLLVVASWLWILAYLLQSSRLGSGRRSRGVRH